jgi:hypothetical protein
LPATGGRDCKRNREYGVTGKMGVASTHMSCPSGSGQTTGVAKFSDALMQT